MKPVTIIPTIIITLSLTLWISVLAAKQWELPWSLQTKETQAIAAKVTADNTTNVAGAEKKISGSPDQNSRSKHDAVDNSQAANKSANTKSSNLNHIPEKKDMITDDQNKKASHAEALTIFDLL